MSGHSKWATIKHKKGAADAKRGQMFTKLIREITVAAKNGGGNPEMNPRLRTAIDRAKAANMPNDNVEKAIKKGTGELPGVVYEACNFEGYGPSGAAIIIETLTDNKNRTTSEVRNIFTKRGGNMAGSGSVAWQFTQKGYMTVAKSAMAEDDMFSLAIEAGADDIQTGETDYEIYCSPKEVDIVRKALEAKGLKVENCELTMLPNTTVKLNEADAKAALALVDALEEHDDVQKVHENFDISDEIMAKIAQEE